MARDESGIPNNIRKVYRRFHRWRSSHPGRSPIPEPLWAAAAEVAREQGVHSMPYLQPVTLLRVQHQHLLFSHPASLPVSNRNFLLCSYRNFSCCCDTSRNNPRQNEGVCPILLLSDRGAGKSGLGLQLAEGDPCLF